MAGRERRAFGRRRVRRHPSAQPSQHGHRPNTVPALEDTHHPPPDEPVAVHLPLVLSRLRTTAVTTTSLATTSLGTSLGTSLASAAQARGLGLCRLP